MKITNFEISRKYCDEKDCFEGQINLEGNWENLISVSTLIKEIEELYGREDKEDSEED